MINVKIIFAMILVLIQAPVVFGQKIDSLRSDGLTIYYETEGKGNPVYLISGGPGITPFYMRTISAELSQKYQTVLIHQRGTGLTKAPVNEKTIDIVKYVNDIDAVKEKLNHGKITLIGHSWGGMLAMNYAALHPEEIDRLILVSSGSPDLSFYNYLVDNIYSKLSEDAQYSSQVLLSLLSLDGNDNETNQIWLEFQNIVNQGYVYDKSKAREIGNFTKEDFNVPAFRMMNLSMRKAKWDLKQDLEKLNINTLIIQGRQDPVGIETANLTNETIKDSKVFIIESCGHFPWIEQPDVFFKTISEFLEID